MTVVDVVISGAKEELRNVTDFISTPSGPFETVDKVVKTARRTARRAASSAGVPLPLKGQMRLVDRVPKLRDRW